MADISPDSARYIDAAVRRGAYATEAEALDEAVGLLKKRDQLRADVQAGINQADNGELLPADEVLDRLEERARNIEAFARPQE